MDKWIRNFVDKYNEMIFQNIPLDEIRSFHYIPFRHLPKGFRRCVSDHLFYYETFMTNKSFENSVFDFILVYRSTPYAFKADFYRGLVSISVFSEDLETEFFDKIPIGKYSMSRFLYGFVSGQEIEEFQSKEYQSYDVGDDQFEIPF